MSKTKTVMVVDGQGGGLGKAIIERLKKAELPIEILAIGSNAAATKAMLKAGANDGATGENAVVLNAQAADYIVGGIGIIAANAMWGEITPAMATAISTARALKVLIPIQKCRLFVAGLRELPVADRVEEAVAHIRADCANIADG